MFTKPQFKFVLLLKAIENLSSNNQNNYTNKYKSSTPEVSKLFILADKFDIKEDGSIIFYQFLKSNNSAEKTVAIPVAAYPNNKWENCLLMAADNSLVAFTPYSNFAPSNSLSSEKDLGALGAVKIEDEFKEPDSSVSSSIHVPGFQSNNNIDYKRVKSQFIESELRSYLIENAKFNLAEFSKHLTIANRARAEKVSYSDSDIQWIVSNMIKNNQVSAQKFVNPEIKQVLDLILPAIVRRHWDGRMSTIQQILQDKDETKNVSTIDLAVWLAINNHFVK